MFSVKNNVLIHSDTNNNQCIHELKTSNDKHCKDNQNLYLMYVFEKDILKTKQCQQHLKLFNYKDQIYLNDYFDHNMLNSVVTLPEHIGNTVYEILLLECLSIKTERLNMGFLLSFADILKHNYHFNLTASEQQVGCHCLRTTGEYNNHCRSCSYHLKLTSHFVQHAICVWNNFDNICSLRRLDIINNNLLEYILNPFLELPYGDTEDIRTIDISNYRRMHLSLRFICTDKQEYCYDLETNLKKSQDGIFIDIYSLKNTTCGFYLELICDNKVYWKSSYNRLCLMEIHNLRKAQQVLRMVRICN